MPIFRIKSVKIYTGLKKFTRTPSVASVTNMRYGLTWRLLIVSSRVALSSKVVRRGAAVLQKQELFQFISNLLFPTHKQLKISTTTTHNQVYQPLPGCGFASDKDRQLSNLEPLIKMDEKVYECGWMYR